MELATDGTVSFEITAFSRPATSLARLAGPLGRQVQSAVTRRYLRALACRCALTPAALPGDLVQPFFSLRG